MTIFSYVKINKYFSNLIYAYHAYIISLNWYSIINSSNF